MFWLRLDVMCLPQVYMERPLCCIANDDYNAPKLMSKIILGISCMECLEWHVVRSEAYFWNFT